MLENFLNWLIALAQDVGLKLLCAILTCIIGSIVIKFIIKVFPDGKKYDKIDPTVKSFLRSFISLALWVVLLVCIVAILGVPMASVIAAIASCGVAIGLAMQGSLSNLAGGIMLLLFRPFSVGEFIEAVGASGTVQEIGIFYTLLITPDNKHVTIPNGTMMNNTVINYSREDLRRVDMDFVITYGSDAERACEIASKVANSHSSVKTDKDIFARVTTLGDSGVTVTVRVWANAADFWAVKFDLITEIRKAFEAEGVSAAYPHMDVTILNK
jgi:small conductance mechanosensitive channel